MARRRCPQPSGLIVIEQRNRTTGDREAGGVHNKQALAFCVLLYTFNSSVQGTSSDCDGLRSGDGMMFPSLWTDGPPFLRFMLFVWLERCILLISASATHWSHSVLAPFTSCTVLPSFDLRLNRKAKGKMFFCGLQTHLCVSLNHDLFIVSLHTSEWTKKEKEKKSAVIISA